MAEMYDLDRGCISSYSQNIGQHTRETFSDTRKFYLLFSVQRMLDKEESHLVEQLNQPPIEHPYIFERIAVFQLTDLTLSLCAMIIGVRP